jgi:hypothetical protein
MTFDEVKQDTGSQFLCSWLIETPKLPGGWTDVQVWLDKDQWLWIWYSGIGAEKVVDCMGEKNVAQRVSDAYANGLGKCAPILYGSDQLMISVIRHRLMIECPGETWVTDLKVFERMDLSAGSGNI